MDFNHEVARKTKEACESASAIGAPGLWVIENSFSWRVLHACKLQWKGPALFAIRAYSNI